jgi:hypothetical protein
MPGDTWNLYVGKDTRVEQLFSSTGDQEAERRQGNVGGLTRKLALSLSRRITAVRRMEASCIFSFRMWVSS